MSEAYPVPEPFDVDEAAHGLEKIVMDELPNLCWDNVSCARVLMNLAARLERMADKLVEHGPEPMVKI